MAGLDFLLASSSDGGKEDVFTVLAVKVSAGKFLIAVFFSTKSDQNVGI